MIDLNRIEVTITERKWMRSAKAFRCYLELPDNDVLASGLTALIDKQVDATIFGPDKLHAVMKPALVVDVPSKRNRFWIVLETVFEHQNAVGVSLTALTGKQAVLSISAPESEKPQPAEPKTGTINADALRGLHTTFFQNKHFQQYISQRVGVPVDDHIVCKEAYKAMQMVESCKDIMQEDYKSVLDDFNQWLKQRGSGGR